MGTVCNSRVSLIISKHGLANWCACWTLVTSVKTSSDYVEDCDLGPFSGHTQSWFLPWSVSLWQQSLLMSVPESLYGQKSLHWSVENWFSDAGHWSLNRGMFWIHKIIQRLIVQLCTKRKKSVKPEMRMSGDGAGTGEGRHVLFCFFL